MKLLGFNSSLEHCTKTFKEETLFMETVGEDDSYFAVPLQGTSYGETGS